MQYNMTLRHEQQLNATFARCQPTELHLFHKTQLIDPSNYPPIYQDIIDSYIESPSAPFFLLGIGCHAIEAL